MKRRILRLPDGPPDAEGVERDAEDGVGRDDKIYLVNLLSHRHNEVIHGIPRRSGGRAWRRGRSRGSSRHHSFTAERKDALELSTADPPASAFWYRSHSMASPATSANMLVTVVSMVEDAAH